MYFTSYKKISPNLVYGNKPVSRYLTIVLLDKPNKRFKFIKRNLQTALKVTLILKVIESKQIQDKKEAAEMLTQNRQPLFVDLTFVGKLQKNF